ncbi:TPA: DUF2316 family protein [Streptococcus agalactiae]|uniref:DUF2316 family protein n=2 Tax=Streptococcus agalactiae TaxID=1311 RepID=Q8E6V0_STRA3|nr:DUF2316 family protein [Streptococcus agalactiae]AHN30036.1 hypothetical protein V193_02325 [Streptococcus agalactiae 138P]EJZ03987.1 hypothetical protein M3M_01297 [Streptococcus agalactiae STIR-CD-17]EPU02120.1 hypothetical protein SAG0123_00245 [Streptococcus agalactiae STIR-CD-13]EPU03802.1 hypothetical protein SAG0122_04100 [Streptococcus agalactiae STIR-CD-09]EPW81344.1 hypothetical protein SAG0121_01625 [Streptococcus agalactiae STIR-CD-07]MBR3055417.1 DUF2316 family protein [Strept
MLTIQEMKDTTFELQENFRRLNYPIKQVAKDLQLNISEVESLLSLDVTYPGDVWMLRDYLEDMLKKEGKEVYPFSRLASHSANRWYPYETPWRY